MSIWAHTLVKNEARWLWFAVASIVEHVDKVLLWDTGSSDGTLKVVEELQKNFPAKIEFNRVKQNTAEEFPKIRQQMLDATESDWFLVVDGDEIWWEGSILKVVAEIKNSGEKLESIVVPTINVVGDIFHFQPESAGKYTLAGRTGHYALRAINKSIPGLHSDSPHGTWGWADGEGKMIQDRDKNKIKFIDAPYLHTTHLPRGGGRVHDLEVVKRKKKYKHEVGKSFSLDYYYPEVFFRSRPNFVPSPWESRGGRYTLQAYIETPLKIAKRRIASRRVGY